MSKKYFFYLARASFIIIALISCTKSATDYPDLKIEDLKLGIGESVGSRDTIYVYFEGRFPNGKVFDKSPRDQPPRRYSLMARTLIQGWALGLVGMKPGGKRRLTIPPELAFGEKGKYGSIPPNATLIFDIELIKKE